MQNKGKILIIIIVIFLAVTSFLALYLGTKNSANNNSLGSSHNPSQNQNGGNGGSGEINEEINDEIVVLDNEKMYFNLEQTINSYYEMLVAKNKEVFTILEDSYKSENSITEYNVSEKIGLDVYGVTFELKQVYCNNDNKITYYFINGYTYTQEYFEGELLYNPNVNFLVIIKNNNYVIRPINSTLNLENYANNYLIKDIELNNNSKLLSSNMTEKNKLSSYINEFKYLLYLDAQRAYDMLTDETKAKYLSYEDFYNNIETIYNSLFTNIYAYGIKEEDSYKIFTIHDMNQTLIKIIEYKTKDFKIGY